MNIIIILLYKGGIGRAGAHLKSMQLQKCVSPDIAIAASYPGVWMGPSSLQLEDA